LCFDLGDNLKTLFYHPPGKPILNQTEYDNMKKRVWSNFLYGFKFKWNFENREGPIPQHDYVFIPGITTVIMPGWRSHIGHWTEATLGLYHQLLYPKKYPWVSATNRILLLNTPMYDIAYNKMILEIILSILPEKERAKLIIDNGDTFPHKTFCLEKANLVGWAVHEDWGGYFASPYEADHFRETTWKLLNITPAPLKKPLDKVTVFLIDRGVGGNGGRRFTNHQEVIDNLKKQDDWIELHPHSGALQAGTFKQQVQWLSETDILLGAHGSGMINSMFLRPHSVVVDMTPGRILETIFQRLAISSGSHYLFDIPHNNSGLVGWDESKYPAQCNKHELLGVWLDEWNCHGVWGYNFPADLKRMNGLLWQAKYYIDHVKRLRPRV